jgi:hypothetical protein
MMVKFNIEDGSISRVAFRPVMINREATPEFVSPEEDRGREVLGYLESITREAGLNGDFIQSDQEMVVLTP